MVKLLLALLGRWKIFFMSAIAQSKRHHNLASLRRVFHSFKLFKVLQQMLNTVRNLILFIDVINVVHIYVL